MQFLLILLMNAVTVFSLGAENEKPLTSTVLAPSDKKGAFPLWQGQQASLVGDVFDLQGRTQLFTYARYGRLDDGDDSVHNVFRNLTQEVMVVETSNFENGVLKTYLVDHRQRGQSAKIEIKDGRVYFSKKVGDSDMKSDSESLEENFIVGMTLIPHLYKNWATLMKGESIKVRFGVWSRLETVGFKFWKEGDFPDKVVIVMKPTSFIIRALVNPLYFTFDKKTKEILQIKGRTTPSRMRKGKWEELDALIKYKKGPVYKLPKLPGPADKVKKTSNL